MLVPEYITNKYYIMSLLNFHFVFFREMIRQGVINASLGRMRMSGMSTNLFCMEENSLHFTYIFDTLVLTLHEIPLPCNHADEMMQTNVSFDIRILPSDVTPSLIISLVSFDAQCCAALLLV